MNKYLKMIVIALAAVIVLTGAAIPILASASGDAKEGTQAAETTQEALDPAAEAALEEAALMDAEAVQTTADAALTSQAEAQTKTSKAIAAAIAVGIAAVAGALGMALAISKSVEGVARQPEAGGRIQTMLMLGLVFIETAIIYALIVAILIVFVL